MLTLNDGRADLWQWDTGRTLSVDADCSQVHFSNKVFGRSVDVDIVDGAAIIPDILLQTDKDLNVWAFVGTAENGYTKISKTFKVNRRNKPADYVFTPPDQTSLEEIKEKIEYLESVQDPDAIKNAVEDYLEQNPVEVPVQSVNGKTGAVKLGAADVGARPSNWMPTAQEVGALPATYVPPDQTAAQVGADPIGTAAATVSAHNTSTDSHGDLRLELKAISDRLTAFFDSDNQTLDELSEIVAYITSNKALIDSITTSKVSVADIVNNLTTNVANKPLSAAQGVVLKELIDGLSTGKLDANKLQEAVNDALAQAKASGEFDGKDGADGYTPQKGIDYFDGADGQPGKDGAKGDDYILTDQDKEEIAALAAGADVPDYWQSLLNEKIALIREAMLEVGVNKSAFFFYSDSHWSNDTTYTAKMAPTLLKYLCRNTPINKTNYGGDIVSAEADDATTMAYLWEWRTKLYGLPNHHSVPGNHDDGNSTNNLFSENYVYGYLLAPEETADIVRGDEGMYYYIDNPVEKTRYLYLDTAYHGVTDDEQAFVKSALLSTPENWHIVAIAHAWYANNYDVYPPVLNGFDTNAKILLDMFDNYNARNREFAECMGCVEFCIGGHYHLDHVEHTDGGVPVIIVEADCLHDRSGTMPNAGTTDEAAVSAVIADYNTKTVKIIRVGRGEDYETTIKVSKIKYTNVILRSIASDGTPFADGKGWMANSRIGSGGIYAGNQTAGTDSAQWVTGHIEINPNIDNVIRLKNVTFLQNSGNTHHGIAFFNSGFTRVAAYDTTSWVGPERITENGGYNPVLDSDTNILEFTLTAATHLTNKDVKYIAICCGGLSDDSIITINEPIE